MSAYERKYFSVFMAAALLCFLVLPEDYGCRAARVNGQSFFGVVGRVAASPGTRNHGKVGAAMEILKEKAAFQHGGEAADAAAVVMKRWKLREVPLGPDPLHHHGGGPRKPRITPP